VQALSAGQSENAPAGLLVDLGDIQLPSIGIIGIKMKIILDDLTEDEAWAPTQICRRIDRTAF
jgi:hypothetical protein